jgi:hypothetical protein
LFYGKRFTINSLKLWKKELEDEKFSEKYVRDFGNFPYELPNVKMGK